MPIEFGSLQVSAEDIRETFVEQYSVNRLEEFNAQIQAQVGPDVPLPDLPSSGSLNLAAVLESEYFFA